MRRVRRPCRNVQSDSGCDPIFRAEIVEVRQELGNDGGRRANPHQQVLEDIQVHRGDRDILIALVFSGGGVGLDTCISGLRAGGVEAGSSGDAGFAVGAGADGLAVAAIGGEGDREEGDKSEG